MLSFGIDASRAFWIAVASAGCASGSPPPSRAATVIARASFVNCWPRLASAAAFLCLIEDHFEWPDISAILWSRGMPAEPQLDHPRRRHGAGRGFAALIVVVAMLVAALSLWTAIPLTWIYIGSRLSSTQFPSGGPYMIVFVGIVISILVIAWLLGRLNGLYVRITGTNTVAPIRPTWLKSMRDTPTTPKTPTVLETVIVGSVVLAGIAAMLWFFLLAGSPIPKQ